MENLNELFTSSIFRKKLIVIGQRRDIVFEKFPLGVKSTDSIFSIEVAVSTFFLCIGFVNAIEMFLIVAVFALKRSRKRIYRIPINVVDLVFLKQFMMFIYGSEFSMIFYLFTSIVLMLLTYRAIV